MDARSIALGASWRPQAGGTCVRLAVWISYLLLTGLVIGALLLAVRRLAGGLESPLSPSGIVSAAALAALLAATVHISAAGNCSLPIAVRWLPAPLLIIFVAALWLPGSSRAAVVAAWCIVAVEEIAVFLQFRAVRRTCSTAQVPPIDSQPPLAVSRVEANQPLIPLLPPQTPAPSAEIMQQSTRSRTAAGIDRLAGWLQMSLTTGERTVMAHVAFCPPFIEMPKISLRQTAGPAGRVRAVQILPHGVRLELKLDHSPRQPQRVSVEFVAESRIG